MRIGLYGLPCAGKSFIMDGVKNFEICAGSKRLLEINPDFHSLNAEEQSNIRIFRLVFLQQGLHKYGCTITAVHSTRSKFYF